MSDPEIVSEKTIHDGWLKLIRRDIRHPNGDIQTYEIVNPDSHSVSVIAFDDSDRILLVEMYRFGQHKRLLEIPAGRLKTGESFLEAARRELLEETGHEGDLFQVGSHYIASEHGVTRHVFVAKSCQAVAKPTPDQSEISEGIKLVKISVDEFLGVLRSGQITETAAGFMAMDYLGLLNKNEQST